MVDFDELGESRKDLADLIENLEGDQEAKEYLGENIEEYAEHMRQMNDEIDAHDDALEATNEFLEEANERVGELENAVLYVDASTGQPVEEGGISRRDALILGGLAGAGALISGANYLQNEDIKDQNEAQGLYEHSGKDESGSSEVGNNTQPENGYEEPALEQYKDLFRGESNHCFDESELEQAAEYVEKISGEADPDNIVIDYIEDDERYEIKINRKDGPTVGHLSDSC
jgi:CRISPR/Cas system-associated exonuclease Cas4 (RecB family)